MWKIKYEELEVVLAQVKQSAEKMRLEGLATPKDKTSKKND